MNKHILILAVTIVFAFGFTSYAHATLIGIQDHGTYLTDTTSELDWLNLSNTVNMSYDEVSAQLGAGGTFEGWTYATAAQFGTLVDDATGINSGVNGANQAYIYSASNTTLHELINVVGDTLDMFYQHEFGQSYCELNPTSCPNGEQTEARGLLADVYPDSVPSHFTGTLLNGYNSDGSSLKAMRTKDIYYDNESSYYFGSFLVRASASVSTVPEPPAVLLFTLGLLCLIPARKHCQVLR